MNKLILGLIAAVALATTACGPKAFVKGEYEDVDKENNMKRSVGQKLNMQKSCRRSRERHGRAQHDREREKATKNHRHETPE